jgi:hypothetical protein
MRRSKISSVALTMVLVACVDSVAPDTARLGRYRLSKINGEDLPGLVVQNTVARLDFLSGALRLNKDGSFTDSTNLKRTPVGPGEVTFVTDVAAGLYKISGDTLYLDSTRGEHYFMTFQSSGSLTQLLGGNILVYRK